MKKILMSLFLLVIFTMSAFAADPYRLDPVGETGRYEIEFTNQENIFYDFPLNPEHGKTVYTEGILIDKNDYFILSTTTPDKRNAFTHVLRYENIDTTNKILRLYDLGTKGSREVIYNELGEGNLVVSGITYFFELHYDNNAYSSLEIDLNGDNRFDIGKRVFISVYRRDGYLDLGPQDMRTGYSNPNDIEFHYFGEPEPRRNYVSSCQGNMPCALKESEKLLVFCGRKEYEVELLVLSETSNSVKFRVNGEITEELFSYDKTSLADGSTLIVEKIDINNNKVYFELRCASPQPEKKIPKEKSYGVDMADYPSFFKNNGNFDFSVVVGDQAPGSDVVAAIDILSGLGAMRESKGIKSIEIGAAKLDTEINYIDNLISVGNPCNNRITEKITGISDCHMGLKKGQGYIGLYKVNNHVQVVVAGYSDFETRMAARALANWKNTAGKHFIVEGESFKNFIIYGISDLYEKFEAKRRPIARNRIPEIPTENNLVPPEFPDGKIINLQLKKGWNLVSLSGELISFLSNKCKKKPTAFVFLKEEKRYVSLKEAAKILGENFGNYLANNAFWIYSYDDCDQKVVVEKDFKRKIVLSPGWNLLPNLDLNCDFKLQYWWNANNQEWQSRKITTQNIGMIVKASVYCEE